MLPGFAEGAFVIQDPAQAWVVRYASFPAGSTVLDACAAPGGKTVAMAQTAGLVVAADKRRNRIPRLLQNLERAGGGTVVLLVADAEVPAIGPVDCVLIDAPCSGTGTFARHPDARHRLQAEDIDRLAKSQTSILQGSYSTVRPGGLLVYATCSLEPEENERQVDRFLASHSEFRRDRIARFPPWHRAVGNVGQLGWRQRLLHLTQQGSVVLEKGVRVFVDDQVVGRYQIWVDSLDDRFREQHACTRRHGVDVVAPAPITLPGITPA